MEVHHHAHTDRKKWTHYFWEFLMLFLAVTLGFFVENQREHYIEHVRAKEFSKTLLKDLQHDTAAIHEHVRSVNVYLAISDSLLSLSKTRLEGLNSSRFSFYTRFVYWTPPIIWNRATFEQIKNSGSLRYFKNYQLQEKLSTYETMVNDIKSEAANHTIRGNLLLDNINTIIDPVYHDRLSRYYIYDLDTMSVKTIESLYPDNPGSLENKRSEINKMLNMVIVQQRNLRYSMNFLWKDGEDLAIELINDLKKEYHIE